MTLRSNITFEPTTSIEVFMDNVREVEGTHSREIVTYQKSQEAVVNTVARYRFPSTTQYIGTLQTNIIENKRKMVYLNAYATNTIVIDGGNRNAIYGSVENLRMANQNTYACMVEFTTKAKGGVSGQFYDSDDCTSSGARTADSDAVNGYADVLSASGNEIGFTIVQSNIVLPEGDYKMFVRAKDTAAVADDFELLVGNITDTTTLATDTYTLTSTYQYYILDFTVASDDLGDSIWIAASKATATSNSISVDFVGFVKV